MEGRFQLEYARGRADATAAIIAQQSAYAKEARFENSIIRAPEPGPAREARDKAIKIADACAGLISQSLIDVIAAVITEATQEATLQRPVAEANEQPAMTTEYARRRRSPQPKAAGGLEPASRSPANHEGEASHISSELGTQDPHHFLIVGWKAICREVGRSRGQLWRDVREGTFPAPSSWGPTGSAGCGMRSRRGKILGRGECMGRPANAAGCCFSHTGARG